MASFKTVGELIEVLKQLPADAEVMVYSCCDYADADEVVYHKPEDGTPGKIIIQDA